MSLTHSIPRARSTLPDKFLMPCLQLFSASLKVIDISYFLNSYHIIYIYLFIRLSKSHLLSTPPKSLPGSGPIIHKPGSALRLNITITIIKRGRETRTQLGQTWNLLNLLRQRFPIFSPLPEKSA